MKALALLIPFVFLIASRSSAQQIGLYDSFGNQYSFSDIQIIDPQAYPPTPMQGGGGGGNTDLYYCEAGYFRIYFNSSSSMYGDSQEAIARRGVICAVLTDISEFLSSDLQLNDEYVNVFIDDIQNQSSVTNAYDAVRSSTYHTIALNELPLGLFYDSDIVSDGEVWKSINTGHDSYATFANPLNLSPIGGGFYHAYIELAFDAPDIIWNTNYQTDTPSGEFDLYSTLLQKFTNSLGIASMIDVSNIFPEWFYTRYDTHLRVPNGDFLIVPDNSACVMYSQQEQGMNFVYLNPSCPCPGESYGDPDCMDFSDTDPLEALIYDGTYNIPVFTSPCFLPNVGLINFEDIGYEGNQNDQYFVMTNAILPGVLGQQRSYTEEERLVLCDLGYHVNNVFNETIYEDALCYEEGIAGVNDGIGASGNFSFISQVGVPFTLPDILANDSEGTVDFSCVQMVTDFASISVNNTDNTITFIANECGIHVLRYIPVGIGDDGGSDGFQGNVTFVFVFTPCHPECLATQCELIPNGGFEAATADWSIDITIPTWDVQNGGYYFGQSLNEPLNFSGGIVECANVITQTSPLILRDEPILYNNLQTGVSTSGSVPPSETHNSPLFDNDNFIEIFSNNNFGGSTIVQFPLSEPLMPNQTYHISYWAKVNNSGSASSLPHIRFAAFEYPIESWLNAIASDDLESSITVAFGYEGSFDYLGLAHSIPYPVELTPEGDWHCITYDVIYQGENPAYTLLVYDDVYNGLPAENRWCFIDDISIVPMPEGFVPLISTIPLPDSEFLIYNLAQFVTPSNGVFSGPGVSVELIDGELVYSFDASNLEAPYTVQYALEGECVVNYCLGIGESVPTISFEMPDIICAGPYLDLNELAQPSGGVFTGVGVESAIVDGVTEYYFVNLGLGGQTIDITYTYEDEYGIMTISETVSVLSEIEPPIFTAVPINCIEGYLKYAITIDNFNVDYTYSYQEDPSIVYWLPDYSLLHVEPIVETTYYLDITVSEGCSTTAEITVLPETCCNSWIDAFPPTCQGGNDGSFDLGLDGIWENMTIEWHLESPDGPLLGTESTIDNVGAGLYYFSYISNSLYCSGIGYWPMPDGTLNCCEESISPPPTNVIPANNTVIWNDSSEDYILTEDLILEDGSTLFIIGRTIRLAEGVKILVKPGASLHVSANSLLTKIPGCGMWKGIECVSRNQQQAPFISKRGSLRIFDSIVEFAQNAWSNHETDQEGNPITTCVDANGNPASPCYLNWRQGDGGLISAINTTFRNNGSDARFGKYYKRMNQAPYSYLPDGSSFFTCTFLLDADYDQQLVPADRIFMRNVIQIPFTNCQFRNEVEAFCQINGDPLVAIRAQEASYHIIGNCTEQNLETCTTKFEGFAYGIYQQSGRMGFTCKVDKMKFNCYRNIYTRTPWSIRIYRNWFEDYTHPIAPVTFTDDYATGAYSVYAQNSGRYDVQQNNFNADQFANNWACVVNNCGTSSNRVYQNYFNNQTRGLNIYNKNRGSSFNAIGLTFGCNDFTNSGSLDVISYSPLYPNHPQNGPALSQGSLSLSASNKFSNGPFNSLWADHLYNIASQPFNYYYCGGCAENLVTGECYYGLTLNQFAQFNECEPQLLLINGNGQSLLAANTNSIAVTQAQYQQIVDGGQTEELTEEIIYADFNDALALYYSLMQESPNLSEEVMIAAIKKEYELPAVLLTQILSSNPTAAKSSEIQKELEERITPLEEYQLEQINTALLLLSQKENKEAELTTLLTERSQLLHEMMFAIDEAADQTDPIGAKLALMQNEVNLDERYTRIQLYLAKEDYSTALSLLEDADDDFQLNRIEQLEVFDLKYLVELVATEPQVLTATQVNRLEQIMNESGSWPSSWASEILSSFGLHEIDSPLYEIPEGEPRSLELNENDSKNTISLYPNPAKDLVIVKGLLSMSGNLGIIDAKGRFLLSQSFSGLSNELPLDVSELAAGIYLVSITNDNGKVQTIELTIQ